MFPHNLSICVVLLALVGGCVADDKHVFGLQLMPTLFGYQHVYKVVINCVKKYTVQEYSDKNYVNKSMNIRRIQFDQIEFNLERCLDETKIIVRMHNIKNLDFPIWPKAYKTSLAIVNQNAVHRISFGNFFKLIIVPWLAAIEHNETAGKTFYRLDIHCAGSTKVAEFKTYTQYDTMVVFNSSKTKCDSYDVKVWPVHEHWLSDNTLTQPPSQNANNDVQKSETAASAPAQQQQQQPLPHLASSQSDGLGNREASSKQQQKLKQVASQSVDQQNKETAGTRQEEFSKSDDDESELTETEKKKLKRMSEDIEELKDNVKLIKKQICGIRSDLRTTVSEISQFLASIE
ncbi:hypothetical protein GPALN_011649 [Globodera pallida]|nr:hypothetical protein GPALN_011649 [Globodera pallida]